MEEWEYFALKELIHWIFGVAESQLTKQKPFTIAMADHWNAAQDFIFAAWPKNFGWKTFHVNSSSCRGACL